MDIKKWNEIPGSRAVENWPYTNLHDLNLDWIINTTKEFAAEISRFEDSVASEVSDFENSVTVKIGEFEGTMQEYTGRMDTALATVDEKITYIDNFFSSLDVQQEINNKLDSMSADGSLAALLKPFADAYMQQDAPGIITAWLTANITEPEGVIIDKSLSIANAAADAKRVGEVVDSLDLENRCCTTILPYQLERYLNNNLIRGVLNANSEYEASTTRLTLPFALHHPTRFLLSAKSGYKISRSLYQDRTLRNRLGGTEWIDSITIRPGTFSRINIRRTDNGDINTDEAPLKITAQVRYNEPIDKAINANSTIVNIAHRGMMALAPENTIPAYKMAGIAGFHGAECDVQFTSDKVAVLIHDNTINRTSNGTGEVKNMTYAQLLQYDFGGWFDAAFTGTKIPTFTEYLLLCKRLSITPYVEIKTVNATYMTVPEVVERLLEIANECAMANSIVWTSYGFGFLEEIQKHIPNAKCILLAGSNDIDSALSLLALHVTNGSLQVLASAATPETISKCKQAGAPLYIAQLDAENDIINADPYITGIYSNLLVASSLMYSYHSL